jgi:hypothetical protein
MRGSVVALVLVAAATAIWIVPVEAQTFTHIFDATNPVVHDGRETGGGSWIDVDGDGDLDLFVAYGNTVSQNNAIFLNDGGMAFHRLGTGPVVNDGGTSIGGCWGDFDHDGRPDLFVTNRGFFGNFLYHTVADTVFQRLTGIAPDTDRSNSNSSSWVDIDGDGDLDLYVVNFQADDFLYLNAGPPTYALTRTVVPSLTPGAEFSIHGTWADFDDDNDMDLFIGNAGNQDDYLFVNNGGLSFARRVLHDGRASLGASWGDYDNDGYLDLFVANYLNQVSILYHNDGPPGFAFTPQPAAVLPAGIANAVGSAWGDVDNDGDLDLLVANDNGESETLYLNGGPPNYTFTRVTSGPLVSSGGFSFGCSLADIDGDGDLDVFVANRQGQDDALYRNDGPTGAWLEVRLEGTVSNRSAIGARVRVLARIGGALRWQTQQVLPLTGYNSQNLELHFGLGDGAQADSVDIRWPSGLRQSLGSVAAGQRLHVVEPSTTPVAASLAFARATALGVEIQWELGETSTGTLALERCTATDAWRPSDALAVEGRSARVVDTDVRSGARYGYRLLNRAARGDAILSEVWIEAASPRSFDLRLASASPASRDPSVEILLPRAGAVSMQVVDARGRVRAAQNFAGLEGGVHTVHVPETRNLATGIYFVRASFAGASRAVRIVLVH